MLEPMQVPFALCPVHSPQPFETLPSEMPAAAVPDVMYPCNNLQEIPPP